MSGSQRSARGFCVDRDMYRSTMCVPTALPPLSKTVQDGLCLCEISKSMVDLLRDRDLRLNEASACMVDLLGDCDLCA